MHASVCISTNCKRVRVFIMQQKKSKRESIEVNKMNTSDTAKLVSPSFRQISPDTFQPGT